MTTETLTYAAEGYSYYSVETPTFFREQELPTDPERDTEMHASLRRLLADLAEQHGTYVRRTAYRRG